VRWLKIVLRRGAGQVTVTVFMRPFAFGRLVLAEVLYRRPSRLVISVQAVDASGQRTTLAQTCNRPAKLGS
jgi:hypothetical protein